MPARSPYPYGYGTDYVVTTSASSANTGLIFSSYTPLPPLSGGTRTAGPCSWQEPGRPATNRERLAAEVDRVCALARK